MILVMDFKLGCPKPNGLFDCRTGRAKRVSVCVDLQAHPTRVEVGCVWAVVP